MGSDPILETWRMKTDPYWLEDSAPLPSIAGDFSADAVVIGGGMAGLTVAQLLSECGRRVVVLERATCGSGATGRSSGFITPDSELQATQLLMRFGERDGGMLWRAAAGACDHIRATIEKHGLNCDYLPADSLYVGTRSTVQEEHDSRQRLDLASSFVEKVDRVLEGDFECGVRYGGTFAMTPFRYAIGLRDALRANGVRIYEHSPVTAIDEERISTAMATIRSPLIFLCTDHHLAELGHVRGAAFHAQTFLAATERLPPDRFERLFPDGDLLVWDTDLIYQYFRRTADDRLLLGGGLLSRTYSTQSDPLVILDHLRTYLRQRLPVMADVRFSHVWSGLIGVTKDLLPLAGRDRVRPSHFYAGCAAGLPWSVLAARCAVEVALDGASALASYFDPNRCFTDLDVLQPALRKPATFALSHAYAKGALRGSAAAVKRRRPFVIGGLAAGLAIAVASLWRGRRG